MTIHAHPHQHSVKVVGSGSGFEEAFDHALAGLTDTDGHYSHMAFHRFELVKVDGSFAPDGSHTVQVTLEAYASHYG